MKCFICKKRHTTLRCFVHKRDVCDDCLAEPATTADTSARCAANCVVRSYFDWIKDGDYFWPPKCGLCNHTMTAESSMVIRLGCHCVFHQRCIQENIERTLLKHISDGGTNGLDAKQGLIKCANCQVVVDVNITNTKLHRNVAAFVKAIEASLAKEKDDFVMVSRADTLPSSISSISSSSLAPPSIPVPLVNTSSSSQGRAAVPPLTDPVNISRAAAAITTHVPSPSPSLLSSSSDTGSGSTTASSRRARADGHMTSMDVTLDVPYADTQSKQPKRRAFGAMLRQLITTRPTRRRIIIIIIILAMTALFIMGIFTVSNTPSSSSSPTTIDAIDIANR